MRLNDCSCHNNARGAEISVVNIAVANAIVRELYSVESSRGESGIIYCNSISSTNSSVDTRLADTSFHEIFMALIVDTSGTFSGLLTLGSRGI